MIRGERRRLLLHAWRRRRLRVQGEVAGRLVLVPLAALDVAGKL